MAFFHLFDIADDLLDDPTSFIHGQSPSTGNVPIYAMVSMCNATIIGHNADGNVQISSVFLKSQFDGHFLSLEFNGFLIFLYEILL